jgi:hypothetical protein
MMDLEDKVLLLGIYKREDGESLKDVLLMLEDSGVFNKKDGKKRLKRLKEDGYIEDDRLSVVGIEEAKKIESEFKI